ncbi:MAG: DEAD/DEAH box helicase [Candidatus Lokiarchaeota archaeon]|nr:DEAD/DEAH box helicase [Candidatus Lokiarchaeota archaeon]MBD3200621.1 DEAD/DEAH box helicase [Candidatus Lokiarchaeota archaeon]
MSNSKVLNKIDKAIIIDNEYIKSDDLELREYQTTIAKNCVNSNSLVVIPTGLGKTIIAVLVAATSLHFSPKSSKIIIMAPTRPLINQHYETFLKFLNVSEEKFSVLTGKISPEKRPKIYLSNQILFFTPHTLRNDLAKKRYDLKSAALLIFDEAHHASGDYPYTLIADEYRDQNPDGTILALTASPGSSQEKIKELCRTLHIPQNNIHIRIRNDQDVKSFIQPMDIYKIGVDLTELMEDARKVLHIVLEERLQYLSQHGFLDTQSKSLHEKVIRRDLLELNSKLISIISGDGDKTGSYSALSINAQGLILFHMLELIEQQGLDVLLSYFEKLYRDARKKNSSKANRILANDNRLRQIYLELKRSADMEPSRLVHPKLEVLEKVLIDEFVKNKDSRVLVFVKFRVSVNNIVGKLKKGPGIRPIRFVGQSTKSKKDKGLSQKKQIQILDMFKKGIYNVLVSTNVGEEGLDIAECDLVIFYDVVASEIRYIQRRGRTARHRKGKVVILYTRNTNDEIYLRIAMNKLNRMRKNLSNPKSKPHSKVSSNGKSLLSIPEQQSNLSSFLENDPKNLEVPERKVEVRVNSQLNMKYGLRSNLKENDIKFEVIDQEEGDIIIYKKICLKLLNPSKFNLAKLVEIHNKLKEKYLVVIIIFEFMDFQESIEGETRLFQKKLLNLGKKYEIQLINIESSEELFFIIKNVYEANNPKISKKE